LVEIAEKHDVVSEARQPVTCRHPYYECEDVVDEGVESLKCKVVLCEASHKQNDKHS